MKVKCPKNITLQMLTSYRDKPSFINYYTSRFCSLSIWTLKISEGLLLVTELVKDKSSVLVFVW